MANHEQMSYSVAGFTAYEIYPYYTQKTKRYFRGYRETQPERFYRIIVYPLNLVNLQPLLQTIKICKEKVHPLLAKIDYVFEETYLTANSEKSNPELVVAVALEDDLQAHFVSVHEYISENGALTESLARDFGKKIVSYIQYMQLEGVTYNFNAYDIFVDTSSGVLKISNFGDRANYKVKEPFVSNIWELGCFLFTCVKGLPPYNAKSVSDPFFSMLQNGKYETFWKMFGSQPSQEIMTFLESCFNKQVKVGTLAQHVWIKHCQLLTNSQISIELQKIEEKKKLAQEAVDKQRQKRKQKIAKILQQRNQLNKTNFRGATNDQFLQTFLDKLEHEESCPRGLECSQTVKGENSAESRNSQIAHLMTLLSLNPDKDVKIYKVKDKQTSIEFMVQTQLGQNIEIDELVELYLLDGQTSLQYSCNKIQGTFFQALWIDNYLKELFSEI